MLLHSRHTENAIGDMYTHDQGLPGNVIVRKPHYLYVTLLRLIHLGPSLSFPYVDTPLSHYDYYPTKILVNINVFMESRKPTSVPGVH